MNREVQLGLQDLHAYLTCQLCNGYLVDATTVVECLHSFCRTCIVRYVREHKSCPVCNVQIHKTRPLLNIRHDQTLQDIVYALVPGLRQKEMRRRKKFWGEREDKALWKHLPPEDMGEVDDLAWKNTTKKICLSIEPTTISKGKLASDSEWVEMDKPIRKRFIRCSQDVTIQHLYKLIRIKLNEDNQVQILLFIGENLLPQAYTLSDVIENFPCKFSETLELTYGVYCPKTSKRKALEDHSVNTLEAPASVNTLEAPALKKRRLPSATPQLQAFFNSHVVKPPPAEKTSSISQSEAELPELSPELPELSPQLPVDNNSNKLTDCGNFNECNPYDISNESVSNHERSVISQNVEKEALPPPNELKIFEKEFEENNNNKEAKPAEKSDKTKKNEENKQKTNRHEQTKERSKLFSHEDIPISSSPAISSVTSQSQQAKKPGENVQFYQMLDIPVDEAVRIKPPTPVESPTNFYDPKAKRNPEPKRPFVEISSTRFPEKQVKNRRKQELPNHHNVNFLPRIPRTAPIVSNPAPIVSTNQGVRGVPQRQPTGRFILLNPPPLNPNLNMRQMDPNPKRQRGAASSMTYGGLSNAQAHKVALEAVRNMGKLQTEKRPLMPKRPILPKTSLVPSSFSIGKNAAENVTSSRNIFQNEKNTFPMAPLSKPPHAVQHPKAPVYPSQKSVSHKPNSGQTPERLLKKMAAAVANSNNDKKNSNSPVRNRPPPPYTVSSFVSYSLPNQSPIVSPTNSNPKVLNLGAPRTKSNQPMARSPDNHMIALTNQLKPANSQGFKRSYTAANTPRHPQAAYQNMPRGAANTIALLKSNRPRMRYPAPASMQSHPRLIAPHPGTSKNNHPQFPGSRTFSNSVSNPRMNKIPNDRNISMEQSTPGRGAIFDPRRAPFHRQNPASSSLVHRQESSFKPANQNRPSYTHTVAAGPSGSLCARNSPTLAPRPYPANRVSGSLASTGLTLTPPTVNLPRGAEKRKLSNPRRSVPSPPLVIPIGTRSPWSQRGYSISPDLYPNPEFSSSSKGVLDSSPPPAHQHGSRRPPFISPSLPSTSSNDDSEQPLELTAKSRRPSGSPLVTSQAPNPSVTSPSSADQPLCLIVKK